MAFPQTPLDVDVELQLGGVWTDITSDVYLRDPIAITRGRADEGARVDPGKCALVLNNRAGTYTPRNPIGPYYGLIGRNTPVRVSVNTGPSYLDLPGTALARATTPDAAALHITGDIDVRLDLTTGQLWTQAGSYELMSRYDNTVGNQRSWRLEMNTGVLAFSWTTDGTGGTFRSVVSDTIIPPVTGRMALRATLDVDNGASGCTVTFYTAPTLAGPWAQHGQPVTLAGTTSVHAGTTPLEIGDSVLWAGSLAPFKAHGAEVRSGIGGSLVAAPDFTVQAPGASSFADPAGRTWMIAGGAALTNRQVRFQGEISSWPPRWDVSGKDSWVAVEAAGILRRLGQGATPLDSTLRRRIPSAAPKAYWPCEEERDATRVSSPVAGVGPLVTSGFDFAALDTLPGSRALPKLTDTASMAAPVPPGTPGAWQVSMVYLIETAPTSGSDQAMLQWTGTGTVTSWRIGVDAGNLWVRGRDPGGVAIVDLFYTGISAIFGPWSQLNFRAAQNGGNVDWQLSFLTIGGSTGAAVSNSYTGSAGTVTGINTTFGAGLSGMALGHLGVFDAQNTVYSHADNGFAAEYVTERAPRLCAEEGVPLILAGWDYPTGIRLGSQRPNTLLDLLDEAAAADQGVIFEQRDAAALRYRHGYLTYNQPVRLALDYQVPGEVAPPLEPVDDDQHVRNDITVQRAGGSSARAVAATGSLSVQAPPAGVGRYTESTTLSLWLDEQTPDQAAWRLHLGTSDEARYPTVHIDLAAGPHLIPAAVAVDIRDRITIAHPPAWLPPDTIDLLVEGYDERIGLYDWNLVFNCVPAKAWSVAVLDDPVLGRADTDGSQLAAGATSTATTLSVATTSGPLWTTSAPEFPFDAVVSGERVTVTNITGAASPQTFTVVRSVNGVVKALPSGADVRLATPMILSL